MIWNCVIALCFVGMLALTLQAQTRADMAKAELVALKAHYAMMDCVQSVDIQNIMENNHDAEKRREKPQP